MSITLLVPLLIVVILIAEIIAGRHNGIYEKSDIWLTAASFVLIRTLISPLSAVLIGVVCSGLLPGYSGALAGVPVWLALPVLLLVGDFLFYWVHRAAHNPVKHPLLFNMHATHHSATYLNISVMARVNVFWPLLQPYTWVAGIAGYLGMIEAAALFFTGMMAWNAFTHTHFRWDDALCRHVPGGNAIVRGIEWVFITPRLHHTHHGYGRDGKAFKNYCTMLSIYDRLFGTLYIPEGRPQHYGILGRNNGNASWVEQLLYPLWPGRKALAKALGRGTMPS